MPERPTLSKGCEVPLPPATVNRHPTLPLPSSLPCSGNVRGFSLSVFVPLWHLGLLFFGLCFLLQLVCFTCCHHICTLIFLGVLIIIQSLVLLFSLLWIVFLVLYLSLSFICFFFIWFKILFKLFFFPCPYIIFLLFSNAGHAFPYRDQAHTHTSFSLYDFYFNLE